ncbi:hypothetical protein [Polaromonas naphthalenivorans]|uniref:Cellulase n=1 Tax=Polaromonas naphthalenivorans (strain CJ2) TaxID=365044 RepID=A1VTJ1_POLNA|nr:hypothetical protein [Polaromonas naphthalenivorans]ABM38969.1 hypothetical protein Pnap_3673 [Polaromonas naphthalenivorans CJ2]
MQRRNFFIQSSAITLGATMLGGVSNSMAQSTRKRGTTTTTTTPPATTGPINAVAAIQALRIPSGPYTGGYEIAPNGLMNWYFANLGLISVVQYLDAAALDSHIRVYLDLYLSKLESNLSIQDVHFPFGRANPSRFTLALADSDDSYVATLLSLAVRYLRASQNWAWWDKNKVMLKNMTNKNIIASIKPSGLTSVFQSPRSQTNNAGYLMDNAEVYRGLRDFAAMLRERGDTADATYYDQFAVKMAAGMAGLFSASTSAFRMADLSTRTETSFYPGTTCQVFPQAFGVAELSGYYDRAWTFFNGNTPGWETGKLDPYPWAVLGLAAAKRGQTALANAQLASMDKTFSVNRALVTINELGFYQRTRSLLTGRSDI